MAKKNNVFIDPKMLEKLKSHGDISKLLTNLIDRYLIPDPENTTVIIKIPNKYKENKEMLTCYMKQKTDSIIKMLLP